MYTPKIYIFAIDVKKENAVNSINKKYPKLYMQI